MVMKSAENGARVHSAKMLETSLDYAYAEVLAGSGGKFTDSVERDAGLRRRENAGF
jgi:hypothetical protein